MKQVITKYQYQSENAKFFCDKHTDKKCFSEF